MFGFRGKSYVGYTSFSSYINVYVLFPGLYKISNAGRLGLDRNYYSFSFYNNYYG